MKNKKTEKKEANKKSPAQSESGSPAAPQPAGNQVQTKKNSGCLTCGIIAVVVVVLLIIGFIGLNILRFWFPPTLLFGLFSQIPGIENMGQIAGPGSGDLFSGKKQPVANMAKAVKKIISAKDGGTIELETEDGLTVAVIIPPGSLEEDTEVVVAPNEPNPDDSNDTDTLEDPGVTVGPPGTTFDPPATIIFSFVPTQLTGSVVPGAGSSETGSPGSSGQGDENRDSERRFADDAVIIVTSAGASNPVPTDRTDDGSAISGPIGGSGSAEPDDPTPEESEDMAETAAAASGGTCSPEFLQAMAGASQSGGPGSSAAQAAIRDCLNTDWLENLCDTDPVKLRRTYFQQRLAIARRYDARAAEEIERLMNQCQARYHFGGEGINPQSTGEVTLFSSMDANVCGYVDDEWNLSEVYELRAGQRTSHTITGTGTFSLPASGGAFYGTARGQNQMTVIGRGVPIPNFEAGFTAYFDGVKTIQNLYLVPAGVVVSSAPIELQEKPCIPVAPLPGGTRR